MLPKYVAPPESRQPPNLHMDTIRILALAKRGAPRTAATVEILTGGPRMPHWTDDRDTKVGAILEGLNTLTELDHLSKEIKQLAAEMVLSALSNAGFIIRRMDDGA